MIVPQSVPRCAVARSTLSGSCGIGAEKTTVAGVTYSFTSEGAA